jgi:hypothetical protein
MKDVGKVYDQLVYFMAIWYILWPFDIFYDHLIYFVVILVHTSCFGNLYQEQSGNPDRNWSRFNESVRAVNYGQNAHKVKGAQVCKQGAARSENQSCQMVEFQNKPPLLVHFGSPLNGKFWYLLWPFGMLYVWPIVLFWQFGNFGGHLLHCLYFGILYQEKSGNPSENLIHWIDRFMYLFLSV